METQSREEFSRKIQDDYRQKLSLNKMRLMCNITNAMDYKNESESYQGNVLDALRNIDHFSIYDGRIQKMLDGEEPVFKLEDIVKRFGTLKETRSNTPSSERVITTSVYLREGKLQKDEVNSKVTVRSLNGNEHFYETADVSNGNSRIYEMATGNQ